MRKLKDVKITRELQLVIAKSVLDLHKQRGWESARVAIVGQRELDHSDGSLAAFTCGGAGSFLYEGFRIMKKRGGPEAATAWVRLVVGAFADDVRKDFKVDLDIFLVGPDALAKILDRRVGRKVDPNRRKSPEEKRVQLDAIRCALEAAAEQLKSLGFKGPAESLAVGAAAMEGLKKRVTG